jgi:exodeoxyribonuclease V alpha subunit
LPAHECGFAISVHRSQGSGYKKVTFLLPGYESAVLCRELLYTGITRAAKEIELWGSRDELLFALKNSRERSSNLFKNA